MSESNEAVIERIRKLMAYAKDGSACEGEVENALGHARKLMDKFNIDEQSVLVDDESARQSAFESMVDQDVYSRKNAIDRFDLNLAHVVDLVCDTRHYIDRKLEKDKEGRVKYKRGGFEERMHLHFYGLPRDVAVAATLYKELLTTMRAMCRFRFGGYDKNFASYCYGFTSRLLERAREAKRSSQTDSIPAGAIILAKDALLKQKAEALGLVSSGRKARNPRIRDEAYDTGREDGSRASIETNGLSSSGTPAPKKLS